MPRRFAVHGGGLSTPALDSVHELLARTARDLPRIASVITGGRRLDLPKNSKQEPAAPPQQTPADRCLTVPSPCARSATFPQVFPWI